MQIVLSDWIIYVEIAYLLLLILISLRVIYDTNSTSKALAYLLLIFFVPVLGILFYFSFGINYRKRKMYSKKLRADDTYAIVFQKRLQAMHQAFKHDNDLILRENKGMIRMLSHVDMGENPVLVDNNAELLINGEAFFPRLIEDLKAAQSHIHFEYYIYENDTIGNEIVALLIAKAELGVSVRFIYDDFGSRSIRRSVVKRLKNAGVEIYPFNKVIWIALANRMNYRNHRKIVVIDGKIGYTGGINISDRYDNRNLETNKVYWRDTHLRMEGSAVYGLQHIFLCDWNFCSKQEWFINEDFFPVIEKDTTDKIPIQIISSGPDSDFPGILYSVLQAIEHAKSEILITTPYYIPDESLQQALIRAALSGKKVKILIPSNSDSKLVKMASESYFEELLRVGVEIYRYENGFVHAKTFVTDSGVSSIGTCNLDHRSFDLNFEVNAIIYDEAFAHQMRLMFEEDCSHASKLDYKRWYKRSKWRRLKNSFIRLLSPLL